MGATTSSCGMCTTNVPPEADSFHRLNRRSSVSSHTSKPIIQQPTESIKSSLSASLLDFANFSYEKPRQQHLQTTTSHVSATAAAAAAANNTISPAKLDSYMSGTSLLDEFNAHQYAKSPNTNHQLQTHSAHHHEPNPLRSSDFKLIKLLSKSPRSSVFFCVKDNIPYAMKTIPRSALSSSQKLLSVHQERSILSKLCSSHSINLEYAFTDSNNIYFITDYKPNGTLADYLNRCRQSRSPSLLSQSNASNNTSADQPTSTTATTTNGASNCDFLEIQRIIAQIVACLWFMHEEQSILYRGLQPENILFDEVHNVCLCDFSDAQTFEEIQKNKTNNNFTQDLHVLRVENQSPEQQNQLAYGASSDYWQLGIIVYQLLYRRHPFARSNSLRNSASKPGKVICAQTAFDGQMIPWQFLQFLDKCLAPDRHQRFSRFIDVQQSQLFAEFDWQSILEGYISRFSPENDALQHMNQQRNALDEEFFSADARGSSFLHSSAAHIGSIQDDFNKFSSKINQAVLSSSSVSNQLFAHSMESAIQPDHHNNNNNQLESTGAPLISQATTTTKHTRKQSTMTRRKKKRSSKILSEILAAGEEEDQNRAAFDGDDECSFSSIKQEPIHPLVS